MSERLAELRARIAECDRVVLAAVNRRIAFVAELQGVKQAENLPFLDLKQEQRVKDVLVHANECSTPNSVQSFLIRKTVPPPASPPPCVVP